MTETKLRTGGCIGGDGALGDASCLSLGYDSQGNPRQGRACP
jgi:hypothetical protein